MKAINTIIAWSGMRGKPGRVLVGPHDWPLCDNWLRHRTARTTHNSGAIYSSWRNGSDAERMLWLFDLYVELTTGYDTPAKEVDSAFCLIDEWRERSSLSFMYGASGGSTMETQAETYGRQRETAAEEGDPFARLQIELISRAAESEKRKEQERVERSVFVPQSEAKATS